MHAQRHHSQHAVRRLNTPLEHAVRARPHFFRVRAAFRADADRSFLVLFRATACACRDKAVFEAACRPSRRSRRAMAFDRAAEVRFAFLFRPLARSFFAALRVRAGASPFFGAGNLTPARRAFDKPMAMACFADRAPCLPSRMWWISSRTNSPACVDGDFPSALSLRARSRVFFSGMGPPFLIRRRRPQESCQISAALFPPRAS